MVEAAFAAGLQQLSQGGCRLFALCERKQADVTATSRPNTAAVDQKNTLVVWEFRAICVRLHGPVQARCMWAGIIRLLAHGVQTPESEKPLRVEFEGFLNGRQVCGTGWP